MPELTRLALASLLLGAVACSDDDAKTTPVVPDASVSVTPDATTPASPPPDNDAAIPPPATNKAIPLVDWVDDLVDHHTDDSSPPDTVDDKNIADDEDPAHFTRRF